jgi:uncharacterized protein YegL
MTHLRKVTILFVLAVLFGLFLIFYDRGTSVQQKAQAPTPQKGTQTASERESKASRTASVPVGYEWPPVPEKPVQPAADFLADNFLVILDASGSMGESECSGGDPKIVVANKAIKNFAATLPEDANLGLVYFSGRVETASQLGTGNRESFNKALDRITARGGTPLVASLKAGYWNLTEQAQRQNGYGTYRLVVITDGESSDGDPSPTAQRIVESSPISIHVIGFCTGAEHSLNVEGFTAFSTADNPEELAQGLASVTAEVAAYTSGSFD